MMASYSAFVVGSVKVTTNSTLIAGAPKVISTSAGITTLTKPACVVSPPTVTAVVALKVAVAVAATDGSKSVCVQLTGKVKVTDSTSPVLTALPAGTKVWPSTAATSVTLTTVVTSPALPMLIVPVASFVAPATVPCQ